MIQIHMTSQEVLDEGRAYFYYYEDHDKETKSQSI